MGGARLLVRLFISSRSAGYELREPAANCICPILHVCSIRYIKQCLHFLDTLSCSPPDKQCIDPRLVSPSINQFVGPTAYIEHWADNSMLYKPITDRHYHYLADHINVIH
jgi:hypothetical protein